MTNAIVVPMDAEVKAGEQPSLYYHTDSAAWDTGAQFTLISPRVIEALGHSLGDRRLEGRKNDTDSRPPPAGLADVPRECRIALTVSRNIRKLTKTVRQPCEGFASGKNRPGNLAKASQTGKTAPATSRRLRKREKTLRQLREGFASTRKRENQQNYNFNFENEMNIS